MATLRKIKSGTWQVNWINPITGKRERPSFHSKKQATEIFNEFTKVEVLSQE